MATIVEFIDCESLSISYDVMGIATVSYTIISNENVVKAYSTLEAGKRTFTGYVSNVTLQTIQGTDGWYENHVTLVSVTEAKP